MPSPQLDNLARTGQLAREVPDASELDARKRTGKALLKDALNMTLSMETRFMAAYGAAFAFSTAALRWHGYRPNDKRYVAFQALEHTLGLPPEQWRVLDKAHTKRNAMEYQGEFEADAHLLAAMLRVTQEVLDRLDRLGPPPSESL